MRSFILSSEIPNPISSAFCENNFLKISELLVKLSRSSSDMPSNSSKFEAILLASRLYSPA